MTDLFLFDYLGTFAFAAFGAYLAQRKGYDIFGVITVAFVSALGGGTLREMLFNNLPVYFYQYQYWLWVILGAAFAVVFYKKFARIHSLMLAIDALGLVTFAYIGASRAGEEGLGFFAIIACGVLTAVGGGILRDVIMRETPIILYQDFYASVAFLVGLGYFFLEDSMNESWIVYVLLAIAFFLRLASIRFGFKLWRPHKPESVNLEV
jgi:uncharacterized membrane protein YeiH